MVDVPQRDERESCITPYAELSTTGQLGPLCARLLYAVARAVSHRFPPPSGTAHWSDQEIETLAHDLMTADRKVPFAQELLAHAADDETLRAYLHRLVKRYLADVGRETTKGARVRRLRPLLKDPRIVRVGRDHYTLAEPRDAPAEPFHPDRLRAAAAAAPIGRPNWGPDTKRTPPEATDASTVEVCVAVLGACPYPLHVGDLADVLGVRFGIAPDTAEQSLDSVSPPPEPVAHGDAAIGGARVDAERVWAELDEEERRTLLVLGDTARSAAERLGVGKTKANALQRSTLIVIARALTVDDVAQDIDDLRAVLCRPDVGPVVLALVELAAERLAGDEAQVVAGIIPSAPRGQPARVRRGEKRTTSPTQRLDGGGPTGSRTG